MATKSRSKKRRHATVSGELGGRARLANIASRTFGGKRDLYRALGYQRELFAEDYRARFDRNSVANRVVKALPEETWRAGAEVIEDSDPTVSTPFEEAFDQLNQRLKIWNIFDRADRMSRIGRFAIIVIGAPGQLDSPLVRATADQIVYLAPYGEYDCSVMEFDNSPSSPRFGRAVYYSIKRTQQKTPGAVNTNTVAMRVHFSRVLHIADSLLDDNIYAEPALKCIWNDLDDLEKIKGGGAEAFWRRADGGTQFDLDPEIELEDEDADQGSTPTQALSKSGLKHQIAEMEHGLRRYLITRGIKIKRLSSDVADLTGPINAVISVISAGTGIPQRVLMGSEQGKLAATADRSTWQERVVNRRTAYAGPMIVRQLVDRLIELGALPRVQKYDVAWPDMRVMDDRERAAVAEIWSRLNANAQEVVVTGDEIRDRVLGLPRLTVGQRAEPIPVQQNPARFARKMACLSASARAEVLARLQTPKRKRAKREARVVRPWDHVHHAADTVMPQMRHAIQRAFIAGWDEVGDLDKALRAKDEQAVIAQVSDGIEQTAAELNRVLPDLYAKTMKMSGDAVAKTLQKNLRAAATSKDVKIKGFAFDVTSPDAVDWIKRHAGALIDGVSDTTRKEVRDLVEKAFEEQFDVDDLADQIGEAMGIDDDNRAETIARTETMTASNRGQQEAWSQAVDKGLLTGSEQQVWIVTPDDRLCPVCEPLDEVKADLDGTFRVDGDDIDGPPAHPNCRCTVGLTDSSNEE